jgi:hypothetical protein
VFPRTVLYSGKQTVGIRRPLLSSPDLSLFHIPSTLPLPSPSCFVSFSTLVLYVLSVTHKLCSLPQVVNHPFRLSFLSVDPLPLRCCLQVLFSQVVYKFLAPPDCLQVLFPRLSTGLQVLQIVCKSSSPGCLQVPCSSRLSASPLPQVVCKSSSPGCNKSPAPPDCMQFPFPQVVYRSPAHLGCYQ